MVRKFFLVSASMLMLALAFHLGYSTATAQAPGNPVVAVDAGHVYTSNGDVYRQVTGTPDPWSWTWVGNVFGSGGPIQIRRETWGQLKSRYAPTPGTAKPGAESR